MSHAADNWPVDGHVHFHTLERVGPTLDSAAANFQAVEAGVRHGAVLLCQTAGEQVFEQLADSRGIADWAISPARREPGTLIARRGEVSLAIVCGRQVRASDGLEVHALGTRQVLADGLPFDELIAKALRTGALVVIPWGFGKWLGRRVQRMEAVLTDQGNDVIFVGDNGTRMELLGVPRRVERLQRRGYRVLPGTDPFPFGRDHRRAGRLGFLAEVEFDEDAPWQRLRDWLVSRRQSPVAYGRGCGPVEFVVNQVGIQLYNRLRTGKIP